MHQLGDRVLDLEPGVHLQEPEPLGRRVVEELDRAGAAVVDRLGRLASGVVQRGADLVAQAGCRCLLDHLLVPALQRAVALAETSTPWRRRRPGPRRAGRARRTARRRRCRRRTPTRPRPRRRRSRRRRSPSSRTTRMPRPPPPADALTSSGRSASVGLVGRLQGRDAGRPHQLLGVDLRAHRVDRLGRRADPGQPGADDRAGEVGVLGQEAVAGVDRVGAGRLGRGQDRVDVEVGLGRGVAGQPYGDVGLADVRQPGVGVGVDRDRRDAERAAGAEDPGRDLGPVGDQQSLITG